MSCSQIPDIMYCGKSDCKSNYGKVDSWVYKTSRLTTSCPSGAGSNYYNDGYQRVDTVGRKKYVRKCTRNVKYSKNQCCFNKVTDMNGCPRGYCPGTGLCKSYLQSYCSNPTNFFGTDCQKVLKNLSAERNAIVDIVAAPICSQDKYKDKPACGCFAIDYDKALKDGVKGPAKCIDPKCQASAALIPSNFDPETCNFNNVICENKENQLELHDQGKISKAEIINKCGITNTFISGSQPNVSSPSGTNNDSEQEDVDTDTQPVAEEQSLFIDNQPVSAGMNGSSPIKPHHIAIGGGGSISSVISFVCILLIIIGVVFLM